MNKQHVPLVLIPTKSFQFAISVRRDGEELFNPYLVAEVEMPELPVSDVVSIMHDPSNKLVLTVIAMNGFDSVGRAIGTSPCTVEVCALSPDGKMSLNGILFEDVNVTGARINKLARTSFDNMYETIYMDWGTATRLDVGGPIN